MASFFSGAVEVDQFSLGTPILLVGRRHEEQSSSAKTRRLNILHERHAIFHTSPLTIGVSFRVRGFRGSACGKTRGSLKSKGVTLFFSSFNRNFSGATHMDENVKKMLDKKRTRVRLEQRFVLISIFTSGISFFISHIGSLGCESLTGVALAICTCGYLMLHERRSTIDMVRQVVEPLYEKKNCGEASER